MVTPELIKKQVDALIEQTKVLDQKQSQEAFSEGLSIIIANAILSAQVVIASNAIVTVGSPSTQTNPTPVVGTLQ